MENLRLKFSEFTRGEVHIFLFTPANSPAKDSRFFLKKLSAPLFKNSPSGSGGREHKIETET